MGAAVVQSPHPLARRRVADCSGDVIPPAQHHPVRTSDSRHRINKVIGATIGGNFGKRRNLSERSQIGVGQFPIDGADMFNPYTVDRGDLSHHQVDDRVRWQTHNEFVDDCSGALFENFDGAHITFHGADTAGDLAESSWPVGQPDANNDGVHGVRLRGVCAGHVTTM